VVLASVAEDLASLLIGCTLVVDGDTRQPPLLKDTVVVCSILIQNRETISHLILRCLKAGAKKAECILGVISL
jgi:hypothetical protein